MHTHTCKYIIHTTYIHTTHTLTFTSHTVTHIHSHHTHTFTPHTYTFTPHTYIHKLWAMVYNIFPPTTATIHYTTGLTNLAPNGHFVVGAQNVCKRQLILDISFITTLLMPAQIKPKSSELRWNSFFVLFLLGADVPHIYLHAWTLCCFQSY